MNRKPVTASTPASSAAAWRTALTAVLSDLHGLPGCPDIGGIFPCRP